MAAGDVEIRLFQPAEWQYYKGVRLKALKSDPAVFGSNFIKESAYPDERWQQQLENVDCGVFGVLHFGDVIGMTGIVLDRENETTAKLWGSWLEPNWRGKGLSGGMYKARIEWAKQHPQVQRIIVSHRQSNTASKKANQKHGFIFTHAADHQWPDGATEPELFYKLAVKS